MHTTLQNMKTSAFETIAYSSHKQHKLEAKLVYVAANQEVMGD